MIENPINAKPNFFLKLNIKISEIIKIKSIKNKTCLNSSYKFTLKRISKNIIVITDKDNEPTIIKFSLFVKSFFSIKGKTNNPKSIINGNLKNNQMNK